jgi:23S rRNA pseudouridine1911/1915/1917 synthase
MNRFEFEVSEAERKMRLEDFLLAKFRFLSKMYLREAVRDGACEVNGRHENRGYRLLPNDFVEIEIDFERQTSLQPELIPFDILFEDADILVVDKPPGMLVHPTLKVRTGTLLNAVAFYLNDHDGTKSDSPQNSADDSQKHIRAGLIHRLDKDTSGLMVVSKNARAHRILASHFQRKLVEKRYFALVEGVVGKDSGTIEAPIGRYEEEKIWNIKADGKSSLTNFSIKKRFNDRTLLELEPVTGRTNQLRIHLAHVGHPIVGDVKYGGRDFRRMCLHAYRLCFLHPSGGRRLEFQTSAENDFD